MEPIRTRLMPTDFSRVAAHAFAQALALARRHNAAIHLLHVLNPMEEYAWAMINVHHVEQAVGEKSEEMARFLLMSFVAKENNRNRAIGRPVSRRSDYRQRASLDRLVAVGSGGRDLR